MTAAPAMDASVSLSLLNIIYSSRPCGRLLSEWMRLLGSKGKWRLKENSIDTFYTRRRDVTFICGGHFGEFAGKEFKLYGCGPCRRTSKERILQLIVTAAEEAAGGDVGARKCVAACIVACGGRDGCRRNGGACTELTADRPRHGRRHRLRRLTHQLRLQNERFVQSLLKRTPSKSQVGSESVLTRVECVDRADGSRDWLLANASKGSSRDLEVRALVEVPVIPESRGVAKSAQLAIDRVTSLERAVSVGKAIDRRDLNLLEESKWRDDATQPEARSLVSIGREEPLDDVRILDSVQVVAVGRVLLADRHQEPADFQLELIRQSRSRKEGLLDRDAFEIADIGRA